MDKHEALAVIRKNYPHVASSGSQFETALRELIPDLKESEDEMVRKALISLIYENSHTYKSFAGIDLDSMIAYLEKQKELDKMIVVSPEVWDNAINDAYENGKKDGEKQKEQTEELSIRLNGVMQEFVKAGKDEEEQEYRLKCYQLFWDALEDTDFFEQKGQKPAEWSEEDEEMLQLLISYFGAPHLIPMKINTSDKVVDFKDIGSWLKNRFESFRPQPKQKWSEEDEKKMIFLERLIEHNVPDGQYGWADGGNVGVKTKSEAISMLKSLRPPQYCENCKLKRSVENWKPSEEQMKELRYALLPGYDYNCDILQELYADLQKLL